ncbi:MAG: hypothetical protein HYX32_06170 [Actinobacteria bacterium]|nr:hypothetical protein [Actinomycetota bacterium]
MAVDSSCLTTTAPNDLVLAGASSTGTLLGPLADNGGPGIGPGQIIPTRRPLAGSPVVDRIPPGDPACSGFDQRGAVRPQGAGCDVGAYESIKGGYHPLTPARILDTRDGNGGPIAPIGPGEARPFRVVGVGGTPPSRVGAVVLNVIAVNPTSTSHLTVLASDGSVPDTSNLNLEPGRTIANLVTVEPDASGFAAVRNNSGTTDVVADVAGYYDDGVREPAPTSPAETPSPAAVPGPPTCPCGDGFTASAPFRILDTRTGTGGPAAPIGGGAVQQLQVAGANGIPADADAVVVNFTITGASENSHLTAWPSGGEVPTASNLNWNPGDTIANQAIVKVGAGGAISLRNNSGSVNVIADVAGWFRATPSGTRFTMLVPRRALDTRSGLGAPVGPVGPGAIRSVATGLPGAASAVVGNLTGVFPTALTHVTAYPGGGSPPNASNLNLPAGSVRPNATTVALGAGARINLRNNAGQINLLYDVFGYFS